MLCLLCLYTLCPMYIGHSWGSDHDPIDSLNQCNPSLDNGGKYLMYQSANDGTLPNNRQFSVCSQASVELVLTAKSSRCFIPTAGRYIHAHPHLYHNYIIKAGKTNNIIDITHCVQQIACVE